MKLWWNDFFTSPPCLPKIGNLTFKDSLVGSLLISPLVRQEMPETHRKFPVYWHEHPRYLRDINKYLVKTSYYLSPMAF